ncbi:hypothetical protein [Acidisoma sp. S159]|uniref:hypothetical protein n=1 Tax=Acidisoma sp. S159 TaxID=1747225 RepID=UPI00131CC08C|nr:hypothetical protein [Acidisoma sp. S159]
MLADTVLSAGADQPPYLRQVLEQARQAVARASRFSLQREVIVAAQLVAEAMPSSILQGLHLCRLPYPTTWFEYAGRDRPGTRAAGTIVPRRVGLLCEAEPDSPHEFTINVFWFVEGNPSQVELCPMALFIDTAEGSRVYRPHSAVQKQGASVGGLQGILRASDQRRDHKIAANPRELEAALTLSNRVSFIKSPYFAPVARAIVRHSGETALESLMKLSRSNAEAEAALLIGVLMLLNTRNGTSREPSDLRKINAVRRKKGQRELLDFWSVNLRLSASRSRALGKSGVLTQEMRAHLVRGHFKIRKSGLYWWSPHVRGDAKFGSVQKVYNVEL